MRKTKKIKKQAIPTFAFVVDGETELWYLQMLKRNEKSLKLNIEPQIPQKKRIKEQFELVKNLHKEYSKVFWIVDLDTLFKEEKEAKKGEKNAMQTFIECVQKANKYPNVIVIVNNPCLEFWFLLHYIQTSKCFNDCTSAETELKKYLPDYTKTEKYYTKQDNDIYLKLKPYLQKAMKNSQKLGEFDTENRENAICEMHKIFKTDEFKAILEE